MSTLEAEPFWLRGPFAPVADEVTAHDLPVLGELPRELTGTYLRNGPNPKDSPSRHWWFGDGMVHGVHLEGGKARWYRNRYVRTARFHGTNLGPADGEDASAARARRLRGGGTSNTHVIEHAGRILSMVEAALPMQLDRELSTVGVFDFDGAVDTPMTAHPKRCPLTGELHFFGYQPIRPYLTYYIADAAGRVITKREIELDGASLMHDFAITRHHALFFDSPARMTRDWGDGMPFTWSDTHRTRIGVVPRAGGAVRWFDFEPGYLSHTANAFERDDGTIVLTGARCARFEVSPPFLYHWEIDLASGRTREGAIDERVVDFPRTDDRRTGQPHRYTYVVELCDFVGGTPTSARLRRYDAATGTSVAQDLGPQNVPGECVFAPRSADPSEDAGFLLSIVYDGARDGSDLVVLDAKNFGAAPLARVRLPQRVPFGFHGSWVPAAHAPS
ncbi:carotenoid oxygenase family protein [Polyangium sp. y55x31]|uniref:carotenoid oxygenase family protein n=1 Tax=Polyangium sp. y55x31 TaxID=3042688 RepID=UPI0024827E51|nr:carotenoid oxygenase family protein [Polyangium sp. y55x31]MDI1480164.1 carotenoid oxygenase family protein [Polyangium sp. y55x31]